ncbi:MAG: DEAD/DEAH box helicase [Betaproteobacteria bacterium]
MRTAAGCALLLRKSKDRSSVSNDVRIVANVAKKLLQRGYLALNTMCVEDQCVISCGLEDLIELNDDSDEIGWRLKRDASEEISDASMIEAIALTDDWIPSADLRMKTAFKIGLDSLLEEKFLKEIIPNNFPAAGNYIYPQASFSSMARGRGAKEVSEGRRADFLFFYPGSRPLVIEIDGGEHDDNHAIDTERENQLAACGYDTVRIPNDEIESGGGPKLAEALSQMQSRMTMHNSQEENPRGIGIARSVRFCSSSARLQYALVRALENGWLQAGGPWNLQFDAAQEFAAAIFDLIETLRSLDAIYGITTAPSIVKVRFRDGEQVVGDTSADLGDEPLRIALETEFGPYHDTSKGEAFQADILIRSAFLPVPLKMRCQFIGMRPSITKMDADRVDVALVHLLQTVFRKRQFREGQREAIRRTVMGKDTVVLLPTGAGKSIVYQLAGLIQPGITIVIDPLVSLVDDQVRGLSGYGIERVMGITMESLSLGGKRQAVLNRVESGEYLFLLMSPERLQIPDFRRTLLALREHSSVNLAVIDEAHCVSEWGHDFRTAYLNLGRNLRSHCKADEDISPPILALTGTASRAVLRDMLADLEIDPSDSDAVIRPTSFNRKELTFEIRRVRPDERMAALRGALNRLPDIFRVQHGRFFQSRGKETYSGLVFTKYVSGDLGVGILREVIKGVANTEVGIYSGKSPFGGQSSKIWGKEKKENAKNYIQNRTPILVSTKAFGMGIDKKNIRYVIHMGMPGSLEAYYQEAGRAGRAKGSKAHCIVIYGEGDEASTQRMVDPRISIEESKRIMGEQPRGYRSDAANELWFHHNSYPGAEEEQKRIAQVIKEIGGASKSGRVTLVFGTDDTEKKLRERAIFRLLQVGLVEDYTVDFGSGKYEVDARPFIPEVAKERILTYVRRSQPGRQQAMSEFLDSSNVGTLEETLETFVRVLTEFSYDVVERARRRAIQEAMDAARHGDSDDTFRRRLLDYLQEGIGAEALQALVLQEVVSLEDWCAYAEKISNTLEAGEFRGESIRFLESYPSHPGLLLLRGFSEALCSDADDTVIRENLLAGCLNALTQYSIHSDDLFEALGRLFLGLATKRDELVPTLTLVLGDLEASCTSIVFENTGKDFDLNPIRVRMDKISPGGVAVGNWISSMGGDRGMKLEADFTKAIGIANSYIIAFEGMRSPR